MYLVSILILTSLRVINCHDYMNTTLPPYTEWPHRPVFIQPSDDSIIFNDHDDNNGKKDDDDRTSSSSTTSIPPIGKEIKFENSFFKGKVLIRIRHIPISSSASSKSQPNTVAVTRKSNNKKYHSSNYKDQDRQSLFHCEEYFQDKKRMRQFVIQGQFKQTMNMADVYYGDIYEKPLGLTPPPFIERILKKIFHHVAPGLTMDLQSKKPKVLAIMAGTMQTMSIDKPGFEPDITNYDLPENTVLISTTANNDHNDNINNNEKKKNKNQSSGFESATIRRKKLSDPKHAKKYCFHPGQVYTFSTYDDYFDLSEYAIKLPALKRDFDLTKILNGQPTSFRASKIDGTPIFHFSVYHEKMFENK